MQRVKVLAVPVYKRQWLYYAWHAETVPTPAPEHTTADDSSDSWLSRRAQGLSKSFMARVNKEWQGLKEAKEGTFKGWLHRLANAVLSREDPTETFLKAVPGPNDIASIEFLYPDAYSETYVRRHLRVLARARAVLHRRYLTATVVGLLPLAPLAATPLPNIPLYYMGYRIYSHRKAWAGARCVLELLDHRNTAHLAALRAQLEAMRDQGVAFAKGSWPDALVSGSSTYQDKLKALGTRIRRRVDQAPPSFSDLQITFKASPNLSKIVESTARKDVPLGDDAGMELGRQFDCPDIFSSVLKVRKKALGSHYATKTKLPW